MTRAAYYPLNPSARAGPLTLPTLRRWTPSLATWSVGAGVGVVFFLSTTPIVRGVLAHIPVLGSYYENKTPPSDKPF